MARTGDGTRIKALGTYGGDPTFAADLTQIAGDVANLIGETVDTYANLPASDNWVGRQILVTADTVRNGVYVWLGSAPWLPLAHVLPTYGGRVKRSSVAASLGSGLWNILNGPTFWGVDQPAFGFTAFDGKWTAPLNGVYSVETGIVVTSAVTGFIAIKKNDTANSAAGAVSIGAIAGTTGFAAGSTSTRVRMSSGDTLVVAAFVSATTTWDNTNRDGSYFGIRYVEPLR